VVLFDNGDSISDIGKHFSPFTITFIMAIATFTMAIGTEPSLSTGYKEELGVEEAGALR